MLNVGKKDNRNEQRAYAFRLDMLEKHLGLPKQQGVGIILPSEEPVQRITSLTAPLADGAPPYSEETPLSLPPPALPEPRGSPGTSAQASVPPEQIINQDYLAAAAAARAGNH